MARINKDRQDVQDKKQALKTLLFILCILSITV